MFVPPVLVTKLGAYSMLEKINGRERGGRNCKIHAVSTPKESVAIAAAVGAAAAAGLEDIVSLASASEPCGVSALVVPRSTAPPTEFIASSVAGGTAGGAGADGRGTGN